MKKIIDILCVGLVVLFVTAGTTKADIYNYSYSADFGGNLNEDQFEQEIEAEPSITSTLIGVFRDLDDVTVHFLAALTTPEKTSLDVLVASHVPAAVPEPSSFALIGLFGLVGCIYRPKRRRSIDAHCVLSLHHHATRYQSRIRNHRRWS